MSLAVSWARALSFRRGSLQPLFRLGQRCLFGHLFRLHARLQIQQEHLILRKLLTLRSVLFKTRQSKLLLPQLQFEFQPGNALLRRKFQLVDTLLGFELQLGDAFFRCKLQLVQTLLQLEFQ